MCHEFQGAAYRGSVRGATETDSYGFGRNALGGEGVARHDTDTGRTHVTHKG